MRKIFYSNDAQLLCICYAMNNIQLCYEQCYPSCGELEVNDMERFTNFFFYQYDLWASEQQFL